MINPVPRLSALFPNVYNNFSNNLRGNAQKWNSRNGSITNVIKRLKFAHICLSNKTMNSYFGNMGMLSKKNSGFPSPTKIKNLAKKKYFSKFPFFFHVITIPKYKKHYFGLFRPVSIQIVICSFAQFADKG